MTNHTVDYAKLDWKRHQHHIRFRRLVESQVPKLLCQECGGAGGYVEPVLDYGQGPFEQCGWCEGTGYLTPWLRGQWLKLTRQVPMVERFWAKVDKNGPVPSYAPHLGPCWVWTAYIKPGGYGRLATGVGKNYVGAHVYSYELVKGAVPRGMVLDHLCRVPSCVNPDHLEVVTHADNIWRGYRAKLGVITHCRKGHPFTPENTYHRARSHKIDCRTCCRERMAVIRAKRRSA
jgi:hypothetical protein